MGTVIFKDDKQREEYRLNLIKALKTEHDDIDESLVPTFYAVNHGPSRKERRFKIKHRCKRHRLVRGKIYRGENN